MSKIKVNYSTFSADAESADASMQSAGDDYSYIVVRSINMAGKDGLHSSVFDHDYRLMAFEFQDYYNADDASHATDDVYKVAVRFSDNTIESVKSIIQSYSDMMDLLSGYQEESMDNCNYGNISEQFNPHFITAMTERYADDPNSAPWVQAPLIFAMHRDLLYDDFGGDKQKIVEYAAAKSVKISPAAGTPTDIEDFYINSIKALWDKYYSTDGIIGQRLSSVGEDEKKILLTQEYNNPRVGIYEKEIVEQPKLAIAEEDLQASYDAVRTSLAKLNQNKAVTAAMSDNFVAQLEAFETDLMNGTYLENQTMDILNQFALLNSNGGFMPVDMEGISEVIQGLTNLIDSVSTVTKLQQMVNKYV